MRAYPPGAMIRWRAGMLTMRENATLSKRIGLLRKASGLSLDGLGGLLGIRKSRIVVVEADIAHLTMAEAIS
jgi:hypothetical protein